MSELAASRRLLVRLFAAALVSVEGREAVRLALTNHPVDGPVWLCAIGKAAESMALGVHDAGGEIRGGLLVTKPGHLSQHRLAVLGIESIVGGHPIPTAGSLMAGSRLLTAIGEAPPDAQLLFLLSGGASSLVEVPIQGLGLGDLQRINQWLLGSGLPIDAMNLVRKSVSRIKGGGLLGFLPGGPVRQLAISDVPGDAVSVIGSGLLIPEPDLAQRVSRLNLPDWLSDWVRRGLTERGTLPLSGPEMELTATLRTAMDAATEAAIHAGLRVWRHELLIEGDAETCGGDLAYTLLQGGPGLHIWGGETTVRLPPTPGRGGRNQQLALAAAIGIAGRNDCLLLSAGTDGTDGPTDDAGALIDGGTLERAALAGFDASDSLARADAGPLLEASGDLIRTGPTGTNVMDLILGLKT